MSISELDFLILYQHRAREMDSICLLRAELERRGYSVDFCYVWEPWSLKYNLYKRPRVVLVSAMWEDRDYTDFVCRNGGYNPKVVSLQWEQVFSPLADGLYVKRKLEGTVARDILALSWGEENVAFSHRAGVQKTAVTGPVHFDFLRENFRGYYLPPGEIKKRFALDPERQTILYISSFAYASFTAENVEANKAVFGENSVILWQQDVKNKQITLSWIKRLLGERDNINFIYRPHPAERHDPKLEEIAAEYPNFSVIRDHSIAQWIIAADKLFTCVSTSIAQAFFAGKYCGILRPAPLLKESEPEYYKNAVLITKYEDWLRCLDRDMPFPIPKEDLTAHYDVQETPSYIRICNVLERVYSSAAYDVTTPVDWKRPGVIHALKKKAGYYVVRRNRGYRPGVKRKGVYGLMDRVSEIAYYYILDYIPPKEAAQAVEKLRAIIANNPE